MKTEEIFIYSIRYAFFMLFIYAGLTKLLEGNLFYDNLYNSPLLPKNKVIMIITTWGIPFLEIGIAIFLLLPKFLKLALKGIVTLIGIYSIYIALILWRLTYQPCSCGGVSTRLSWEQHLVLNGVVMFLGIMALHQLKKGRKDDNAIQ